MCPATFVLSSAGDNCICPPSTTLYSGSCVGCNVANCQLCQTENICTNCVNNLTVGTSSAGLSVCQCIDSTFVISSDNTCVCPAGTLQVTSQTTNNPTCQACLITNCQTCPTLTSCTACTAPFVLNSDSSSCVCPSTMTLFNGVCYTCDGAQFCTVCSATNICNQCQQGFVVNSVGACVCPVNTTLYNNQCVACNVLNCQQCQTPNVCSACTSLYTLDNNYCLSCNIQNCNSCSLDNFCASCSNQLIVSSQGNLCVTCNVLNCVSCSFSDYCD